MDLWIYGQLKGGWDAECAVWEFAGVFNDEVKAVDACRDETYFIYPVSLNQAFPHDSTAAPPGSYYPLDESKEDLPIEEAVSLLDGYEREVALQYSHAVQQCSLGHYITDYLGACCKHAGELAAEFRDNQERLARGLTRAKLCALFRARLKKLIGVRGALRKKVLLGTMGVDPLIRAETAAYEALGPILDVIYKEEIRERMSRNEATD